MTTDEIDQIEKNLHEFYEKNKMTTDENVKKSGLLFDQIERQIIREFYEKSKTKSKSWIWWHKNSIVTRFETLRAQRNFNKEIKKSFEESWLFKLMAKSRKVSKTLNNKG